MTPKTTTDSPQGVDPDTGEIVDAELLDEHGDPTSQALARIENTASIDTYDPDADKRLLAAVPVDDEWSDIEDDGDWTPAGSRSRIPHITLNRKLDGGFTLPDTGELVQEVDVVLLARGTSRAWFPRAFDGKNPEPPDCRSFDGRTADPNSPDLQNNGDCLTCPHAQWTDDPPACKASVEALVFLLDPDNSGGQFARIRFGGIAVGPFNDYWERFARRVPRKYPFAYLTHIALEAVDTDNGKFLRPRLERVRELARRDVQPLLDERDARKAEWAADIRDDVTSGATVEQPAAGPFDDEPLPTDRTGDEDF